MASPDDVKANINLQKPSGTIDQLPEMMDKRRWLTRFIEDHFQLYGYQQVDIPIYDFFQLYELKSGEKVINDIFTFLDPPKHRAVENPPIYALRPEFTAPLVRAYISTEMMYRPKPQKYFYIGPCFRYDEPSPGRYRQFTQAGVEIFGADSATSDAEMMIVPMTLMNRLGIQNFVLRINDLTIIRQYLNENSLDQGIQSKIIGIIDNITSHLRKTEIGAETDLSKEEWFAEFHNQMNELQIRPNIIDELELLLDLVGTPTEVITHLEKFFGQYPKTLQIIKRSKLISVCDLLEAAEIKNYVVDCGIARGLDYYTDIVFEIDVPILGREKQICGGGRYNQMIENFGGEISPACGFSFGFERIIITLEKQEAIQSLPSRADVFIGMKEDTRNFGINIAEQLRKHRIRVELDIMDRSFRSAAKLVNRLNIPFMIFIGPREKDANKFTLKNFHTEEQFQNLSINDVITKISEKKIP